MKTKIKLINVFLLISGILLFLVNNAVSNGLVQEFGYTENKGQIVDQNNKLNRNVQFLGTFNNLNVQIRNKGWSYETFKTTSIDSTNNTITAARLDFNFVNPSKNVLIQSNKTLGPLLNFYGVNLPQNGIHGIKTYSQIEYLNVWDGVNIEFVVMDGKPKYNVHVDSPNQLSKVALEISGASSLKLIDNQLQLQTINGTLTENIPLSFITMSGGRQEEVQVEYQLKKNVLTFSLLSHLKNWQQLTIDPNPQLEWSKTYGSQTSGSGHISQVKSIELNSNSEVYSVGNTNSTKNIATSGTHSSTMTSARSVGFIIKTDQNGNQIWGTYYGTNGSGTGFLDIALVGDTQLVAVGNTVLRAGIATSGTFQPNFIGGDEAFLVKFDSSGTRKWGSYFGGKKDDYGLAIVTDKNNNIYFVGKTNSIDTIASSGAFKSSFGGVWDGFIAKFNSSGTRSWSTYFGASNWDELVDITIDTAKNLYVIGSTKSTSGISTTGSYQTSHAGGTWDGVIAKFSASGSQMWTTYFGGSLLDDMTAIYADNDTSIYIAGSTNSKTGITTTNSHHPTKGRYSTYDGVLAKFSSKGKIDWSTYLWGNGYAVTPLDIHLKNDTSIFVCGEADAGILELSSQYYFNYSGTQDRGFLLKFNQKCTLLFGTDLSEQMQSWGVRAGENNSIYVGGEWSTTTPNTYAKVTKYKECPPLFTTQYLKSSFRRCLKDTLTMEIYAGVGTTYKWTGPNNFKDTLSKIYFNSLKTPQKGIYNVTVTDTNGCKETYRTTLHLDSVKSSLSPLLTRCKNHFLNLRVYNTSKRTWYLPNNTIDTNSLIRFPYIQLSDSGLYGVKVYGSNGCEDSVWTRVVVNHTEVKIDSISPVCVGQPLTFRARPSYGRKFEWYSPKPKKVSSDSAFNLYIGVADSGLYYLYYLDSNWCMDTASVFAKVYPLPNAQLNTSSRVCEGGTFQLYASGGTKYKWAGPASFNSSLQNPVITNASSLNSGKYWVTVTNQYGCKDDGSIFYNVRPNPTITIQNNSPICEGDRLSMSASGASTYLWTDPVGGKITFNSWTVASAGRHFAGNYSVVGTDQYGCKGTNQSTAIITTIDIVASSNSPVTEGNPLNLFASGGTSYQWDFRPAFFSLQQNPTVPSATLSHAGIYKLEVSKGNCSKDTTLNIVIKEKPIDPNVSVNELNGHNKLKVYPNPSINGKFWVDLSGYNISNCTVQIRNSLGQEVYRKEVGEISIPILVDISESGIFFLSIRSSDRVITENFRLVNSLD